MSYADMEFSSSTSTETLSFLPDWVKENRLVKKYVTRAAKKALLNTHSEKYLAAWINKKEYVEKIYALQADFDELSYEVREKVEAFMQNREENPHGKVPKDPEVTKAINIKMGIEALKANYHTACLEFDGYGDIIKTIKDI